MQSLNFRNINFLLESEFFSESLALRHKKAWFLCLGKPLTCLMTLGSCLWGKVETWSLVGALGWIQGQPGLLVGRWLLSHSVGWHRFRAATCHKQWGGYIREGKSGGWRWRGYTVLSGTEAQCFPPKPVPSRGSSVRMTWGAQGHLCT